MSLKFAKLTRPALRSLRPGERIIEHGIEADRLRTGDIRYSVNIMVDGRRIHRVIGRESEGCTREQAERAVEGFRTKAREDRLDLPSGRKSRLSFGDASEEYLSKIEHHPKHGRNLIRKRQHMRQRLVPHFKQQRPDQLTDVAISQYVKSRREEGASQATINRELATLSHFLHRASEWGWIKRRPRIDKGAEQRKQIVVLSSDQRDELFKAAIGDQDPLTWLFVSIAMGTAMRHSEILRIRWDEIHFSHHRIFVGKAKAGERIQPIAPSLAETLHAEWKQLGEPAGYIFLNAGRDFKRPYRTTMASQFARTVKRAGLDPKKVTPHVLRHTAITELVKAGVDLPTIQKISGHKTLAMVLRYTHLSDAHVDHAIAVLSPPKLQRATPKD